MVVHGENIDGMYHLWCCFFHKGPSIGFEPLLYSTDEESEVDVQVCVELTSSGTHPNPIPFSMSTELGTAVGKTAL